MGTDVYLEWKGMTEEDKEKRYTGYSIEAGNVGYLRASIGMIEENRVLRAIFPEKLWKASGALLYDFKGNEQLIVKIIKNYLAGNTVDVQGREDERVNFGKVVAEMIKKMAGDDAQIFASDSADKVWAKSVLEFCVLGIKLQKENKKPKVNISW